MTVPMQRGSMAVLPSRSRFMITDILGGSAAANVGAALHLSNRDRNENGRRSPSPQSPRDLSASSANNNNHLHHLHHNLTLNHHHHLSHAHDEDSDSSGPLDDDSKFDIFQSILTFCLSFNYYLGNTFKQLIP